jgi:hypothetical protein
MVSYHLTSYQQRYYPHTLSTMISKINLLIALCIILLSHHAVSAKKKVPRRLIAALSTYPGYTGNLTVTGSVAISFSRTNTTEFKAHYFLKGLDPACSAGCGFHIHTGTTCSNASLVGGHYWTPSTIADPWDYIFYYASKNGTASGIASSFSSGYNYSSNIGHAVVIHTAGGTRVACGTLQATKGQLKAEMGQYPGNSSPYNMSGKVAVTFLADDTMRVSFDIEGTFLFSFLVGTFLFQNSKKYIFLTPLLLFYT